MDQIKLIRLKEASAHVKFMAFEWLARYITFITPTQLTIYSPQFKLTYLEEDIEEADRFQSLVHNVDVIPTIVEALRRLRVSLDISQMDETTFDQRQSVLLSICAPLLMNTNNLEALLPCKGISDLARVMMEQ